MAKLPIIHNIEYPVELLDNLKRAIDENNQISNSYNENKFQYDNLEKALEPVLKISKEGLTFPYIDITNLPSGVITKQANFDARSQELIIECIKLKKELMDKMHS